MPPGVAVCFSSLFIRLVCMAFLTSSDKALWHLALPMIFSNITVPLLGLVDTAVIGHLDSPVYLGGVAVGATATSFLFMLLLFLRMSTTGLTAQAYGAKNPQALARALVQPLLLALGAGALIALLRTPIIDLALHIVGGSEAVLEQARRFLEIRWLSAPASLANLVLLGWLLGVQYARAPVILLVVGNILNIVLDVWLVMGLHMNVQGAALATVIAEYATLLIGLLMVRKILKLRGISGEMLKTAWRGNFRRLLALNRDIMLRSLLLQLCFGAITVLGARLGSDIIAVNAVLMTLLTFTAYALDGFAYAVEAHSGQAYGARDGSQLLDVWRAACRQSGIVALLFSVVYLLVGEHIIALLTSLTQIQQLADRYLIWQVILPLVGVWCYLLDGMFIGATRAAEMRNSMAVAAAGFALTLLTLPWLGNHGLWLALTVFLALRGLSLAAIWRRHWRNGTWFAAT
ncbi:MATE family efflux transporter DinF [Escherichia coli]|nr:MATE family efflux transporter DinF [Escherichia coli]EGA1158794.1 MATE family efflux transporter DinF [Escherichia coli]EGS1769166.1 MATE family efflux transporter DinF [Escherichia coli]HAJ7018558.1 MATE family efflux transporter DinF [Escherichia coli]